MKDSFTTSGYKMEPYGLKNMNIQNLWTPYQIYTGPLDINLLVAFHFKS